MRMEYWLYDARYNDNSDRAIVLCVAHSIKEAKKDKEEMFPDAIIVEHKIVKRKYKGKVTYEAIETGGIIK